VKNLFDDPRSPSDLMVEVARFLRDRGRRVGVVRDVLVYFLGHGVPPEDQRYFLVTRYTKEGYKLATGLSASILVEVLVEQARHARCHLILDVCFAGAAARVFFNDPRPHQQLGLFCASGPDDSAKAPDGQRWTMFTGTLLDVLRDGSERHRECLSTGDVYGLVTTRLKEVYQAAAVLPQIHNPGQQQGLVTDVALFPNRWPQMAAATGSPAAAPGPLPALPAGPLELIIRAGESLDRVEEAAIAAVRLGDEARTREMQALLRRAIQTDGERVRTGLNPEDLRDYIRACTQFQRTVSQRYAELRDQVDLLQRKTTEFCDMYPLYPLPPARRGPNRRKRKDGS
jgi:hypothetical protein